MTLGHRASEAEIRLVLTAEGSTAQAEIGVTIGRVLARTLLEPGWKFDR